MHGPIVMDAVRRFYSALPLPAATKALLAINVGVFVLNALLLGRLSEPQRGAWLAFSGPGLLDGYGLGLLRVISYQFTHSFDSPMHVLMNMVSLWVFGPIAESRLGPTGLYRVYLWGGLVGALGHLAVAAAQGLAGVPLVGASGACYALLVYAACVQPHARIVFVIVQMPLWLLAGLLCALGAYELFVELTAGYGGGVSHSAHLGGAALGWTAHRLGWFQDYLDLGGRPGLFASLRHRFQRLRQARAAQQAQSKELQLDQILAKVKANGLSSLHPDERRFLERLSQDSRGPGK